MDLRIIRKGDAGLSNVDNTSDVNKPVSTAQQTALNLKADKVSSSDIEITDFTKGIILKTPDGSRFRLTLENDGTLITTEI